MEARRTVRAVIALWIAFFLLVLLLLAFDLGVINRKAHVIGLKEAVGWSAFWISLSLLAGAGIYAIYEHHWFGAGLEEGRDGATAAMEYLTGWLIEKSLSVDNIFVIALIFRYFAVPPAYQHRVLFWGILGALVMRGVMIGAGIWLVSHFDWIFYVFGALLLYSAFRMLSDQDEQVDPETSRVVRWARKVMPLSSRYEGQRFTTRVDGRFMFTPLMLVLIVIETADVVFAVDSIPAIFGITTDPFLVMTSNVFAILGLRALYFVLAGVIDRFRYLAFTLTIILGMVGAKMLLHHVVHVPTAASLLFIVVTLTLGIVASVWAERNAPEERPQAVLPRRAGGFDGAEGEPESAPREAGTSEEG